MTIRNIFPKAIISCGKGEKTGNNKIWHFRVIQFVPATNGKTKVSVVYSAIGTKNVFSIFMLAHCFGCFGVNYNYNIMIIIIIIMLLEIV